MIRAALAATTLIAATAVGPAVADPPLTPRDVPCPSVSLGGAARTVLALTTPGLPAPRGLAEAFGATPFAGVPAIGLLDWVVPAGEVSAFVAALARQPGVTHVQLDHAVTAARTPRDPLLPQQWALARMHLSRAWDVDVGASSPVRVAVLDSGVDGMHPDLIGRVEPGIDTVDGDTDATDEHFHGTAVASVIAADTDNKIGMAGVSWGAQIVPVRVLGSDGIGTECTIAAGIVWAAGHAPVLNMSLGAPSECSAVMQQAVDYALRQGALLIAAAGNSARSGNPPEEPSDCAGVVAVGATDRHDHAAAFSEHGPQVSLSAPGVRILAAYRAPHGVETWAYLDGTSMSAPLVSGVAALLLSRHPTWSATQVVQRMVSTAVDLGRRGRDDYFGAGLVDAARAMRG